jgi:hypothetical protein
LPCLSRGYHDSGTVTVRPSVRSTSSRHSSSKGRGFSRRTVKYSSSTSASLRGDEARCAPPCESWAANPWFDCSRSGSSQNLADRPPPSTCTCGGSLLSPA